MKVPSFRPPTQGDYPGLGEENHGALKVLSDQLELVTQCLQSNISPEDNSNVEVKTVGLESGVDMEIELNSLKGTPREVVVVNHSAYAREALYWEVINQSKIKVRVDFTAADDLDLPDIITTTLMIRGPNDE